MRYEAKHRTSKIAARSSFNRRNICMSLAIKYQLKLNETFLNSKLPSKVLVGPCKVLTPTKQKIVQNELNLNVDVSLDLIKWAKVKGSHYKTTTIVTKDILEDNLIFGSIKNLFFVYFIYFFILFISA